MALFKIEGELVRKLGAYDLDLEKKLQKLFEKNLESILNITFLASEYSTSFGGRIDTLGLDSNGSPCIIEYKRGQNENVINQGLSYLRWLLDHKADFEKLVASNPDCFIEEEEPYLDEESQTVDFRIKTYHRRIDWDSPRVICIAESYNKFDLDTVEVLPINIELLRYRIYDENILYLEAENSQKIRISTSGIVRKNKRQKINQEKLQKTYTVAEHLTGASKETSELFGALREAILALDEAIREEPMKFYIAYKLTTNFVDVAIHKNELKIFVNVRSGELDDPKGKARDMAKPQKIGHHGNGDYEIRIRDAADLADVFPLIKQSYDLNK